MFGDYERRRKNFKVRDGSESFGMVREDEGGLGIHTQGAFYPSTRQHLGKHGGF